MSESKDWNLIPKKTCIFFQIPNIYILEGLKIVTQMTWHQWEE